MASTSNTANNGAASTSNGVSSSTAGSAQPDASNANANMHFDVQAGKWIFENPETGQEFEWNTIANAWVPIVEDDVVQAQQAAYSVQGVDESAPANVLLARDRRKKRKAEDGGTAAPKKAAKAKQGPRNTAVYLTNLPRDATTEEVAALFARAGLILLDADGKPKVKLYNDRTTGEPNGEGLVVYYKEESVRLAINLLDDTPLRLGGNENIKVAEANWSHRETTADGNGNASDQDGGDKTADSKKKKGKSDAEKQKMQRRAEKLLRDAADYDPSYDEKDNAVVDATAAAANAAGSTSAAGATPTAKNAGGRVVVLQYVFTLEELGEDASLLLDLKEDVRDECESLGKVTNVVLYDKEPDGIVTIKFADPLAAQACIVKNNNRFFGGRQLKAWLYDGKKRYQKSGNLDSLAVEGESEDAAEARRLEEFGKWLEEDNA